jgi:cytochrome c553
MSFALEACQFCHTSTFLTQRPAAVAHQPKLSEPHQNTLSSSDLSKKTRDEEAGSNVAQYLSVEPPLVHIFRICEDSLEA